MKTGIVWFRQDLRLADNPALYHACEICDVVIPLFIDDPNTVNSHLGSASNVWLHHSLQELTGQLVVKYNSTLIIKQGSALELLPKLVSKYKITHVFWNRCYYPGTIRRDTKLKTTLVKNCEVKTYRANLIHEPWTLLKQDGAPYRVYTPFWKRALADGIYSTPLPAPTNINTPDHLPDSLAIQDLKLLPQIPWYKPIMSVWEAGEDAAHNKLQEFLDTKTTCYQIKRNLPAYTGTSRLSPHLHFGEISPTQIIHAAIQTRDYSPVSEMGIHAFLGEVGWREFAYHLLYHYPQTTEQPLNARFINFPWTQDYQAHLKAWQKGQTGYPIIDAGMRELWQTGWMHNRVRMIVASFLTKNLLIPWQEGEAWFRDTLVDADLASNVMGWQWVAGSGADAAPYFRIFNPILQSQKFDSVAEYIRRWIPELKDLDSKQIHFPNKAINGYPAPIVDLMATRARALEAYKSI